MKRGKFISAGIACIVAILALLMEETAMAKTVNRSGSSKSDFAMECINTCKWTASDIETLQLKYYFEEILILPSPNNNIILKQYLSCNDSKYLDTVSKDGNAITITQGQRPSNVTYQSKLKLYIPDHYNGTVELDVDEGSIAIRGPLAVKTMMLNLAEGKIQADKVTVINSLTAHAPDGVVYLTDCTGNIGVEVGSGSVIINSCNIGGSIKANDYTAMNIGLSGIYSNLRISNKEGTVRLGLPGNDSFRINAFLTDKDGVLRNNFSDTFTNDGMSINGTWGSNPKKNIIVSSSDAITLEKNK